MYKIWIFKISMSLVRDLRLIDYGLRNRIHENWTLGKESPWYTYPGSFENIFIIFRKHFLFPVRTYPYLGFESNLRCFSDNMCVFSIFDPKNSHLLLDIQWSFFINQWKIWWISSNLVTSMFTAVYKFDCR